jgi:hypothetical protein
MFQPRSVEQPAFASCARNELVIERCCLERVRFEPSAIFDEQVISGITGKFQRLKSAILSSRIVRGEYQKCGPDAGCPKGFEHLEVVGKFQNLRCLVAWEIHDKGWRFRQVFEQLFEFIFGATSPYDVPTTRAPASASRRPCPSTNASALSSARPIASVASATSPRPVPTTRVQASASRRR